MKSKNQFSSVLELTSKKIMLMLCALFIVGTFSASAQFGKLLDKVKGKPKTEATTEVGGTKSEEPQKKKAQKKGAFASVWESEFDNKATVLAVTNSDGSLILGTDDNSASVLDASGKPIWSGDYKKITTNHTNNCEYQFVIFKEDGGYLFLFDSRSMGTDRVACIDLKSGKEMWNSEAYQNLISKSKDKTGNRMDDLETVKYISELDAFLISQKGSVILVKATTGEKIWETNRFKGGVGKYIYDAKRNQIIMLNFKPTALGALFTGFKNQLVKIDANNGEILWDAIFTGDVEKELITGKFIVDLSIKNDKLFMYLNGLQVYNLDTGKKLWEATYENDMERNSGFGTGMFKGNEQKIYRTLADPLFDGNSVYITMFGKSDKTKYIEKHDVETGKLIWTTDKVTGALCIPNIYKTGNKLLVQVGGKVQVQGYKNEMVGTEKVKVPFVEWQYKNQKNGVYAIDDATGKVAWRSEKFDKRITDLILDDDKTVFVGDGDEFYGYDIASGKQLFDIQHDNAKVGKANDVVDFGNYVVVLSDKGLAAYAKKDGSLFYTTGKIGNANNFHHIGDNYFIQINSGAYNIFKGIDMETGTVKGIVESKGKGGSPKYGDGIDITADGEYIFAFKGKKVEKVQVNN